MKRHVVILIVDDDLPIVHALAIVVQERGYAPLLAQNGAEALTLARAYHPTLVITDLMMPGMNGVELVDALHLEAAQTRQPPPAILLISAAGALATSQVAADAVLPAPFDPAHFEALLDHLLR